MFPTTVLVLHCSILGSLEIPTNFYGTCCITSGKIRNVENAKAEVTIFLAKGSIILLSQFGDIGITFREKQTKPLTSAEAQIGQEHWSKYTLSQRIDKNHMTSSGGTPIKYCSILGLHY